MKRWMIIFLGTVLSQALAQVPNMPTCTQGCCTKNGQMGGKNKEECTGYCHTIFGSMANQGTPQDQVAATNDRNSPITRLTQCKDACVHNCRG